MRGEGEDLQTKPHHQGSADRPYNNEIVIISPNEAKSLSKGLLNLGNITKVVSNRGKAKM